MARTTMSLAEVRYRPNKKKHHEAVDKIGGVGLLQLFYDYCDTLHPDTFVNDQETKYTIVASVSVTGCCVTASIEHGNFGNPGKTRNKKTHIVTHNRSQDEAATVETRVSLVVPPGSQHGLFLIEREGNFGGGGVIYNGFLSALREANPNHFFPGGTLEEPAAWLQQAKLRQVRVTAKKWKNSISGAPNISSGMPLGTLTHTLTPESGIKYFPDAVKDAVMSHQLEMTEYMEVPDGVETTTDVTLERDGRPKTFELDRAKAPSLRILLSQARQARLDDDDFVARCFTEAQEFYSRLQLTWNGSWETGAIGVDSSRSAWEHRDADSNHARFSVQNP